MSESLTKTIGVVRAFWVYAIPQTGLWNFTNRLITFHTQVYGMAKSLRTKSNDFVFQAFLGFVKLHKPVYVISQTPKKLERRNHCFLF